MQNGTLPTTTTNTSKISVNNLFFIFHNPLKKNSLGINNEELDIIPSFLNHMQIDCVISILATKRKFCGLSAKEVHTIISEIKKEEWYLSRFEIRCLHGISEKRNS